MTLFSVSHFSGEDIYQGACLFLETKEDLAEPKQISATGAQKAEETPLVPNTLGLFVPMFLFIVNEQKEDTHWGFSCPLLCTYPRQSKLVLEGQLHSPIQKHQSELLRQGILPSTHQ